MLSSFLWILKIDCEIWILKIDCEISISVLISMECKGEWILLKSVLIPLYIIMYNMIKLVQC